MTVEFSRIACLGPQGTFTEEATLRYLQDSDGSELVLCRSIADSIESVIQRDVDAAVVPYQNTIGGLVAETHDVLFQNTGLRIYDELILPIEHCLIAPKSVKDISRIHIVASHPQAFAQCREYLKRRLPNAQRQPTLSTAQAVIIAKDKMIAAIASRRVAEMYDAHIVECGIEDNHNNSTRFVVVRLSADHEPTGNDKTTLIFSTANTPGALIQALQCFVGQGINLLRIESFSLEGDSSVAFFTIDCEGHRTDLQVSETLGLLQQQSLSLRIVGSYPRSPHPA